MSEVFAGLPEAIADEGGKRPYFKWDDDLSLRAVVLQALGGASMCWKPQPTGEFIPHVVIGIADELIEHIHRKFGVPE